MTAAAIGQSLPDTVAVTIIETGDHPVHDMFYGHVLPPQAYAFHLSIGLSEPELLLNTDSTFILGTDFQNWAQTGRSWVQAFHQPLPVWDGVPVMKLVAQTPHVTLQSTLIGAQAALSGRFAHPPEDAAHPLSRAEYGYAFDPRHLTRLYKIAAMRRTSRLISAQIDSVQRSDAAITRVTLSDGQSVSADLFVDCTGPKAALQAHPALRAQQGRTVRGTLRRIEETPIGAATQQVRSGDYGWRSEVVLRSGACRLTVTDPHAADAQQDAAETRAEIQLGSRDKPWTGNCVAVGQAAGVLEPFTTAPMKLLLRDIDRLINLVPVSGDMQIEAREYNRMFRDDFAHAHLFNQAHFAVPDSPATPYWQATAAGNNDPKLVRKLTQYDSRGHLVAYDNEPFDGLDWAVLHDGIGRTPKRRDPVAALSDPVLVRQRLDALETAIQETVKKMPPQSIYLRKFLSYLQRKYARNG
jgi:tryptophan halogenase